VSGIFGIFRFGGDHVAEADVERLAEGMAQRGPDGRDLTTSGPVGLGRCLMRVTPEDAYDVQPLTDPERDLILVADCRLDNREDLAAAFDLPAATLDQTPDSALILMAYQRWGEDCPEHLLGDFAFAAWDGRAKTLILARDHMGQRGLLFHRDAERFIFASDRQALWKHPDVPQRPLGDADIGRMLIHDMTPRDKNVAVDTITGFGAGSVLTVHADGRIATRRYWTPRADPAHEGKDEAYYVDAYRRVLGEAVTCRLRRLTAPPGIIFSGGYDSGGIAALAGATPVPGGKLIAATSVMPADYRGTIRHARRWVDLCKRDMPWLDVRYVTREGQNILTGLEQHFIERGAPAGSYHFVQTELLSTLAGAGARMIMDGHGGDYTLNPRGQAALARHFVSGEWRRFFKELPAHRRLGGRSWWSLFRVDLAAMLMPAAILTLWRRAKTGFAPVWRDQPINETFARELMDKGEVDPKGLRLAARSRTNMREQLRKTLERIVSAPGPGIGMEAAYHGLDLTRPFHDKRVVELALAIPEELYVKNGRNRHLACMALKDLYPPEYQGRWRKNDDEIPDFQRMAKSIEPQLLADIARMEKSAALARYVDFGKVRRLLAARPTADDHNSGWEQETQLALGGYLTARYIEWARRDNQK
jgi:asparagine synthase (glutamine-hydrolysing)